MDWPIAIALLVLALAIAYRWDDALEALRKRRERRIREQLEYVDLDKLHSMLLVIARDDPEHGALLVGAATALEVLARENVQLRERLMRVSTRE